MILLKMIMSITTTSSRSANGLFPSHVILRVMLMVMLAAGHAVHDGSLSMTQKPMVVYPCLCLPWLLSCHVGGKFGPDTVTQVLYGFGEVHSSTFLGALRNSCQHLVPLNPVPNLVFGKSGEAGEAVCSFTERSKDYPCGWPPGPRPQKQLRVGHRLIPFWTANVCRIIALYGFFGSLFYLLFGGFRFRVLGINVFSNCHCDFWPTLGNTLGIHRVSVEAAGVQVGEGFAMMYFVWGQNEIMWQGSMGTNQAFFPKPGGIPVMFRE